MRFSVIIPLYNKAPYVAKAIECVLSQTYTDFELVIVNDGSKDDSALIAQRTIEGHENCRLINQENAGVSVARNKGVASSNGDYLCFLDSDDWWDSRFLESMSNFIEEYPKAGIYGTNYTIVNEARHKTCIAPIGVDAGFKKGYINYCHVYAKTLTMPLWTGAVCVPRLVFDEVGGFNPQLRMGEDFDLWIRIAIKYKVALLNEPLAFYNQDVEVQNRAIGSLPPPITQFAFNTDYLNDEMEHDSELKNIVECIQIICLRNYYLSKAYHKQADEVLRRLDLNPHLKHSYADYLTRPVWLNRLLGRVAHMVQKIKYGK